jgi:hypothetical protein
MPNLVQHLRKLDTCETLKQVQGDKQGLDSINNEILEYWGKTKIKGRKNQITRKSSFRGFQLFQHSIIPIFHVF